MTHRIQTTTSGMTRTKMNAKTRNKNVQKPHTPTNYTTNIPVENRCTLLKPPRIMSCSWTLQGPWHCDIHNESTTVTLTLRLYNIWCDLSVCLYQNPRFYTPRLKTLLPDIAPQKNASASQENPKPTISDTLKCQQKIRAGIGSTLACVHGFRRMIHNDDLDRHRQQPQRGRGLATLP